MNGAHRARTVAIVGLFGLLATCAGAGEAARDDAGVSAECAGFQVAGIRLGMASDVVRVRLGSLGTPVAVADDGTQVAALVFEIDDDRVEVEFDRRPRRRRPGHVIGVQSSREEQTSDAAALLAAFEQRLGPADADGRSNAAAGETRRRWSSVTCGARLELAIEEQIEWWQPHARRVVVRLRSFDERGGL